MLSERDYMGRGYRENGGHISPVLPLIALNVVCFLCARMGHGGEEFEAFMLLTPHHLRHFQVWRLFTYMFAHYNFMHIFFNMWGLFFFGRIMYAALGLQRFLVLYFVSGVIGGLSWLLFNWSNMNYGLLGASGAIFGLTTATAMAYPRMQVRMLFPPVTMTMRTLAICYMVLEVIQSFGTHSSVAHIAHLGGALGAFITMRRFYLGSLMSRLCFWRRKNTGERDFQKKTLYFEDDYNREEIIRILNKISTEGFEALTKEERQAIADASRRMKK